MMNRLDKSVKRMKKTTAKNPPFADYNCLQLGAFAQVLPYHSCVVQKNSIDLYKLDAMCHCIPLHDSAWCLP